MPRLNKKDTARAIATKIEEQEQAELGLAHDNTPISFYSTRPLKALAKELEVEDLVEAFLKPTAKHADETQISE